MFVFAVFLQGPKENKKTGLIEKWSGGIKKGWRAYLFTLDLKKKIFQYTRVGVSYSYIAKNHNVYATGAKCYQNYNLSVTCMNWWMSEQVFKVTGIYAFK